MEITDRQKADLLSFVTEDARLFRGPRGQWRQPILCRYADLIGGNLTAEFYQYGNAHRRGRSASPGMGRFPREFQIPGQFHMSGDWFEGSDRARGAELFAVKSARLDAGPEGKRPRGFRHYAGVAAEFRADNDFPIVWARQ